MIKLNTSYAEAIYFILLFLLYFLTRFSTSESESVPPIWLSIIKCTIESDCSWFNHKCVLITFSFQICLSELSFKIRTRKVSGELFRELLFMFEGIRLVPQSILRTIYYCIVFIQKNLLRIFILLHVLYYFLPSWS